MMRGALVVAAVGVLGVACAPQGAVADARTVDMCTILTDAELNRLGVRPDTRETLDQFGSVGCEWVGKPLRLSLERDKETVASYRSRQRGPAFITFAENEVNGRAGLTFAVDRDGGTDCEQLIDGGSVSLVVHVASTLSPDGHPIDACPEALRIAQLIEPRLPKVS
ncbi:MAG: DUF3558 domain-containing protein [Actinomycetota bacterium]|nr:DUF3558 domain-containing protein [Actinomycetota bacterium]